MSFYAGGLRGLAVPLMGSTGGTDYNPRDPLDVAHTPDGFRFLSPGSRELSTHFWWEGQYAWRKTRALAGVYSPDDLHGDIQELQTRMTHKDQRLESQGREVESLRAELRDTRASHQEKERASTQRNEALQAQIASLTVSHHALELAYRDQQRRLAELEGHNAALQAAYDGLRERM